MEDITLTLEEALEELVSAEDFLEYFDVPYDQSVVHVNRLHILQRFHDYMAKQAPNLPPDEEQQRGIYRLWLSRAYQDFVESNSITEKVFAVFQNQAKPEGGFSSFVSIDKVFRTE
ncbi:nitrogenase-stabilizing/protective protein NifW [Azonexus sp. IMCC34839]|uniref:nitrogenase-stabilizing/protective protein NifW n=1 Tax=Azonexus sp. IMCC34839 TaxID=3133695 RepID=UPI00399ADA34